MARLKLTRVHFCESCYNNRKPNKGEVYVTIGRARQKYEVRVAENFGKRGFTSHVIELVKSHDGKITYRHFCAMHDCGCYVSYDEEKEKYLIDIVNLQENTIPIADWNQMVLYRDDPDYHLGE